MFVVIAMIATLSSTAFASVIERNSYTAEIDGGYMHSRTDDERLIVIMTNTKQNLIDVSVKYFSDESKVIQYRLSNLVISTTRAGTASYWDDIIAFCDSNKQLAEVIEPNITDVTYEEPIVVDNMRNQMGELLPQLRAILGESEFTKELMFYRVINGQVHRVYESLKLDFISEGYKTWNSSTPMTVTSFIVSVLGLIVNSQLIATVCGAFGVATSAGSLIASNGRLDEYTCRAIYDRHVTINGSEYIYNIVYKFIDYKGYDDSTNSVEMTAFIDETSAVYDYTNSGGEAYYLDYTAQMNDAYEMFLLVGQKP